MARPHDYSQLPSHPAVSPVYKKRKKYGWTTVTADVTCPTCGKVRSFPLYTLRQQMLKPHFNGQCLRCGQAVSRAATRKTLRKKFLGRTRRVAGGYVVISASAIPEEDIALFNAMRGSASFVLHHRWVMAKHLGRALVSDELVHHKNGKRDDNRIENLELCVKFQPPSQRVEDQVAWAIEILRRYRPESLVACVSLSCPAAWEPAASGLR